MRRQPTSDVIEEVDQHKRKQQNGDCSSDRGKVVHQQNSCRKSQLR
jgi:hypothetical protein